MNAGFYRPASQRTPRPSRRRGAGSPLVWAAAALLFVVVSAGGGLLALRFHPRFDVARVVLEGVPESRRSEAEELTDSWIGQPLLFVDVDGPVKRLSERPWVARAGARRMVPDTIVVTVFARPPLALARVEGALVTIDRAGTVLGPYSGRVLSGMDDFPLVSGDAPEQIAKGAAFVTRVADDDPALLGRLSEVEARTDGFAVIDKLARMRLLFGADALAPGAAVSTWRVFLALLPELERRGLLSGEVDLRFANRIVLKAPASGHGST
jgi:cell division septal protein FtsQ